MTAKTSKTGTSGRIFRVTTRLTPEQFQHVKSAAADWGVSRAFAASRLIEIGGESKAATYDPNKQFEDIGFVLNEILNRLDLLDKLAEVTARAALKSGMFAVRQIEVSASAPEVLKHLDTAVEKTIEEIRK